MGKKKNKPLIRPWCWYCEREFEDEKVLMQHQKAKHFKCGMCPRRLNTAGGLAVHIQQVHKLEPENLPRIDNALPGRDGYEVEIFGMEGIPAPDVADYKRRKEIELGLNPGSISQPPPKRAKTENRPLTEDELRAQLEAHKALMGGGSAMQGIESKGQEESKSVYGAFATTYAVPPQVVQTPPVQYGTPPVGFPPGPSPGVPGAMPPFAPPFFPPGVTPPPGFRPPFPPPPGMPGAPPMPGAVPPFPPPVPGQFPPGPPGAMRPPFPPPPGFVPGMPLPPGVPPMGPPPGMSPMSAPPPAFVPASAGVPGIPHPQQVPFGAPGPHGQQGHPGHGQYEGYQGGQQGQGQHGGQQGGQHRGQGEKGQQGRQQEQGPPPELKLPNPALEQTNPEFKKPTELKWADANFSPEERRANHPKYYYTAKGQPEQDAQGQQGQGAENYAEEPRGKKRARAEDFL